MSLRRPSPQPPSPPQPPAARDPSSSLPTWRAEVLELPAPAGRGVRRGARMVALVLEARGAEYERRLTALLCEALIRKNLRIARAEATHPLHFPKPQRQAAALVRQLKQLCAVAFRETGCCAFQLYGWPAEGKPRPHDSPWGRATRPQLRNLVHQLERLARRWGWSTAFLAAIAAERDRLEGWRLSLQGEGIDGPYNAALAGAVELLRGAGLRAPLVEACVAVWVLAGEDLRQLAAEVIDPTEPRPYPRPKRGHGERGPTEALANVVRGRVRRHRGRR